MSQLYQHALPPGTRIESYEIHDTLGIGAFGITYRAYDHALDRVVAIKEYLPSSLAVRVADGTTVSPKSEGEAKGYRYGLKRFLDEARTLAKFHEPHIVRIIAYMEAHGTAYFVMDYEDGVSLDKRLQAAGTLAEEEIRGIVIPILRSLRGVHAQNFLHRDIKPANIYLRRDRSPVLLDFGSARQAMGEHGRAATGFVTPGYAPFEQYLADGKQGPWSDIYAIGATMYHCIAGVAPVAATERVAAIHDDEPDPLPGIGGALGNKYSTALLDAMMWMLRPMAKDRPQSVDEALAALASTAIDGQQLTAPEQRRAAADNSRNGGGTTSGKKEVERRQEQPPRAASGDRRDAGGRATPGAVAGTAAEDAPAADRLDLDAAAPASTFVNTQQLTSDGSLPGPAAPTPGEISKRLSGAVQWISTTIRGLLRDRNRRLALGVLAGIAVAVAIVVFLKPHSTATPMPAAEPGQAAVPPPAAAPPSLLKQAESGIAAGHWKKVAQLADDALGKNPKNAEALLLKGHIAHLRDRRPPAAVRHYGDALRLKPDLKTDVRMLANLVGSLEAVGEPASELLARYPSPPAVKLLAERTGKPGFAGRNLAADILSRWREQKRINEGKRALLDLEEAPECPQRRSAIAKIRELKLKQALPMLKKMADVNFFERVFTNHPNACLFDEAKKTIDALEDKTG
ncbi:MAG: protein kinase [Gammaproteobacteria bacterium]|nr:protein kinase [Gammaproteobacteria bacterium]